MSSFNIIFDNVNWLLVFVDSIDVRPSRIKNDPCGKPVQANFVMSC